MREKSKTIRAGAFATVAVTLCLTWAAASQAGVLYGGIGRGSPTTPGAIITINQTTGAGVLVGDPVSPGGLTGIDFNSLGQLWGSSINGPLGNRVSEIVQINPDTGALISSIAITRATDRAAISIGDLAIQPGTDTVFGIKSGADAQNPGGELFTIDTGTGLATLVGNTLQNRGGGLAFAPNGTLYFLEFSDLHTLNPLNGSILTTTTLNFGGHDGLAVRDDGVLFASRAGAGTLGDEIRIIDPILGTSTLVGQTGAGNASDLAFRPMQVAEPGTLALFGLGLAGIAFAPRRKAA